MTTYAILHENTRIVMRATNREPPQVNVGEIAVVVADGFDLAGGPFRLGLDNVTRSTPTEAQIDEAFTTPDTAGLTQMKALVVAVDALPLASVPQEVKDLLRMIVKKFHHKVRGRLQ
jgi:hypothetical protein